MINHEVIADAISEYVEGGLALQSVTPNRVVCRPKVRSDKK